MYDLQKNVTDQDIRKGKRGNTRFPPITSIMNNYFYDIETLDNVFTIANFKEDENQVELFYILDDPQLLSSPTWQIEMTQRIMEKNKNFTGTVVYYNILTTSGAEQLLKTFGAYDACDINTTYDMNNMNKKLDMADYYAMQGNEKQYQEMQTELKLELNKMQRMQGSWGRKYRLVADTDADYDINKHPYLWGYNSYNYDTTMLAILIPKIIRTIFTYVNGKRRYVTIPQPCSSQRQPYVTAKELRELNDVMFKEYKDQMPQFLTSDHIGNEQYQNIEWRTRKNMLLSGRHLDVARLNEKQSKVALKRILGMLGFQILESNKLKEGQNHINNADELYELIAYNVSDVINLHKLFYHKTYFSKFKLKRQMLQTYPELIYEQTTEVQRLANGTYAQLYKPDTNILTRKVRRDRLTIDSSSAQFATKCLCPYGHLDDIETVSFMYPSENKAKELGIKRVNVLEETRKFFYKLYPQPELREQFDRVYYYYKSIEGKNFNGSKHYKNMYPNMELSKLSDIPKVNTCLPYFDENGKETSCYVQFSTGGIHGAEYNYELFMHDMLKWQKSADDMQEIQQKYPNPVDLRKTKEITMNDGRTLTYKVFLRSGRKIADSEYKDIEKTKPVLFKLDEKTGVYKLNNTYVFTSVGETNHEDFTSYYPGLLMAMEAFMNKGLGYDRYNEIFGLKQKYGKLMKDKSLPETERETYSILREGTKLVLNSASGAADAKFENNILVNNQIISMRIIGQLFTWRIGQAQTHKGAKIISTNTDGLYSVMEQTLNNAILAKESDDIGVAIEPEPMFLISKDTNNRIEMESINGKILNASGGTLGCRKGPDPTKSLAHPAIIDWGLAEYLIYAAKQPNGISTKFNRQVGLDILNRAKTEFNEFDYLCMFQNVLASSIGSVNYIYAVTDADPNTPIILQHYNRAFMMKQETPNTVHLWAANAKKITPATIKKREKDKTDMQQIHPLAMRVLRENGAADDVKSFHDVVCKKVTNLSPDIAVCIQNKDLHYLTDDEKNYLIDNIDINCYLDLLQHAFEESWMNVLPENESIAA